MCTCTVSFSICKNVIVPVFLCLSIVYSLYPQHLENYEDKMVPRNHPYLKRVQHVGNRLVRANADTLVQLGMEHKEWKCYVINDPQTINAFVLPVSFFLNQILQWWYLY